MKILHVITGLGNGGAESALFRLISNDKINKHYIIYLSDKNFYLQRYQEIGIKVCLINFKKKFLFFFNFFHFISELLKIKPDTVQTWMYHGNFIGGIFSKICLQKNIIWNIRNSDLQSNIKMSTKFFLYLNIFFSHLIPKKIIYCSNNSIDYHHKIGFSQKKTILIYNGYQKELNYSSIRNLNLEKYKEKKIMNFGLISRWDRVKNHYGAIKFISELKKINKFNFRFFFAGENINENNIELNKIIFDNNLVREIVLLGDIINMQEFYQIIDINFLFSKSESFPNVLAESMLFKVPCISSNVGDAKIIVDKFGWIFEQENKNQFLSCVKEATDEFSQSNKWNNRKQNCQNHILTNFSTKRMIDNYNSVWKK